MGSSSLARLTTSTSRPLREDSKRLGLHLQCRGHGPGLLAQPLAFFVPNCIAFNAILPMSVTSTDNDWEHLYPTFREKLQKVLEETSAATGYKWVMTEGYRSNARQAYLYEQGRTRPGPIVTWMKTPKNHGSGCAADCYPTKNGKTPDFSIGVKAYETFRSIYQKHGLGNGAWGKGDLGHVELTDAAIQAKARKWIAAGFPDEEAGKPVSVYLNNRALSPLSIITRDGLNYIAVSELKSLGTVKWDGETKTVRIEIPQVITPH